MPFAAPAPPVNTVDMSARTPTGSVAREFLNPSTLPYLSAKYFPTAFALSSLPSRPQNFCQPVSGSPSLRPETKFTSLFSAESRTPPRLFAVSRGCEAAATMSPANLPADDGKLDTAAPGTSPQFICLFPRLNSEIISASEYPAFLAPAASRPVRLESSSAISASEYPACFAASMFIYTA